MDVKTSLITNDSESVNQVSNLMLNTLNEMRKYYCEEAIKEETVKYSQENIQKSLDSGIEVLSATVDKSMVGIQILSFDASLCYIEWMTVTPEWRNRGINKLLLGKTIELAKNKNCHKIWCDARTSNSESISFLLKNGFNIITKINKHWFKEDYYLFDCFLDK